MVLGMTHGELGLVLFIFGTVYFAQFVPKLGARAGQWLGRKKT
jgi:hypothetical protein